MDGRFPSSSTSTSTGTHHQQQGKPTNLRSSVSMFIEDSRITAVANADVSPLRGSGYSPSTTSSSLPTSFYSVTSYTSALPKHSNASPSWNLRPPMGQISTTLPEPIGGRDGRRGGTHASPVRSRACSASPARYSRQNSSGSREIIHKIIRESSVEDELNADVSQAPPPPPVSCPSSTERPPLRRTTLSLEPVISFINVKERLSQYPNRIRDDRAYTSVNLTLRSPTSGAPSSGGCTSASTLITQGFEHSSASFPNTVNVVNTVVDMEAGGTSFRHVHNLQHPANLMYSTYSKTGDGFEAQVQIQFGPHGGTFTASRRRNHNISMHQMNSDLLTAQTERKDKLRTTINDRKIFLAKLQTEIVQLRSKLQQNPISELEKLKQENQRLRIECDYMARKVDLYQNGSVPLGETDEEFYQSINPGQDVAALFGIANNRRRLGNHPPPRPPPPKFLQSPSQQHDANTTIGPVAATASPDEQWRCSMCTFQNHRDLDFCEQCQMVRVKHGPSREQNIRIRVVRHQQQQPQEQQRRVVHSWVM